MGWRNRIEMNYKIFTIIFAVIAAIFSQIISEWFVRSYLHEGQTKIQDCLDLKNQKLWLITYIIIAAASGILFTAYDGFGITDFIRKLVVMFSVIAIGRVDYRKHIIPNKSVIFIFLLQLILISVEFFTKREEWKFIVVSCLIGFCIASITFFVGYVISRKGLGMGDLKLMAALGFCLGDNTVAIVILFSLILSAGYGIYKLLRKQKSIKDEIAYAPFVAAASVVLLLLGF